MVKGKVCGPFQQYKENMHAQQNPSLGKKVWKGFAKVGEVVVGVGKVAGKQIGKAARNYSSEQQRMQTPQNQGKQKSMFPDSGFGF